MSEVCHRVCHLGSKNSSLYNTGAGYIWSLKFQPQDTTLVKRLYNVKKDTNKFLLYPRQTNKVKKYVKFWPVDSRLHWPIHISGAILNTFSASFHTCVLHQVLKICIRFPCLKIYIKTNYRYNKGQCLEKSNCFLHFSMLASTKMLPKWRP